MSEPKDPQWGKLFDRLTDLKQFDKRYGVTPAEVIKSWPAINWTPNDFYNFCLWCLNNRLHPHATNGEVQVSGFNSKNGYSITYYAKYIAAVRTLVRFNVITDIIQEGVIYAGEQYEFLPNMMVNHVQQVDVKSNPEPLYGYIVVERTNGRLIRYTLTAAQLNDPKRNKGKDAWLSNRHEMYVKSMYMVAYRKLSIHINAAALAFEDDAEQEDTWLADQPQYNEPQQLDTPNEEAPF